MEAGPELDALVAEKVMGYRVAPSPGHSWWRLEQANGQPVPGLAGKWWATPDVVVRHIPYSTDIAAAWLVVERLRERGWDVCVSTEADTGMYHTVALRPDQLCSEAVSVFGRTAPLSICLAALERLNEGATSAHHGHGMPTQ